MPVEGGSNKKSAGGLKKFRVPGVEFRVRIIEPETLHPEQIGRAHV